MAVRETCVRVSDACFCGVVLGGEAFGVESVLRRGFQERECSSRLGRREGAQRASLMALAIERFSISILQHESASIAHLLLLGYQLELLHTPGKVAIGCVAHRDV